MSEDLRDLDRAWKKSTRRAPRMAYGRVPSPYKIKLAGETVTRRVYEDWTQYREGFDVPLVLMIGEVKHSISRGQVEQALFNQEAYQAWQEEQWRS